jgi:hypothetical protein
MTEERNIWQQAVINACRGVEECYFEGDPKRTINTLIDWHVAKALEEKVSIWDLVDIRNRLNGMITHAREKK